MNDPITTIYVCSRDGYHEGNSASWCNGGCGRDYNRMIRVGLYADPLAAGRSGSELARWATVVIDGDTMMPREATRAELEELDDVGVSVDRLWIVPGPIGESRND